MLNLSIYFWLNKSSYASIKWNNPEITIFAEVKWHTVEIHGKPSSRHRNYFFVCSNNIGIRVLNFRSNYFFQSSLHELRQPSVDGLHVHVNNRPNFKLRPLSSARKLNACNFVLLKLKGQVLSDANELNICM